MIRIKCDPRSSRPRQVQSAQQV